MLCFGFGFNAFGQIVANERKTTTTTTREESADENFKVRIPTNISQAVEPEEVRDRQQSDSLTDQLGACWSRRLSLCLHDGGGHVVLSGFGSKPDECCVKESLGCRDAAITEKYLTLAFTNKIECWDLERDDKSLAWSMEVQAPSVQPGASLKLPLVPGGYIAAEPPFYRSLSPHLKAASLALGAEHAILLSATGTVYTWGLGSHGQLGHEVLTSEKEPKAVEALWGVPMSSVATGGWHSACISAGGDLYVWGWNESGQLGFPSQAMRNRTKQESRERESLCLDPSTAACEGEKEGEKEKDVFISIQAFPALLDVTKSCEITKVGCGSRHTAAVTNTGDLYTWGWGEYGQLGHKDLISTDEPRRVEFFRERGLRAVDVVCGTWNTFVAALKEEVLSS